MKLNRAARLLLTGLILLVLVLVLALGGIWAFLLASRAQLNGRASIPNLSAPVLIERDALGVPTIHATNRLDATRALGFLHAQERFFQMDLNRRAGGGELSELFGTGALSLDMSKRALRPRTRAREALAAASPEDRALLRAYTEGLNAGLQALSTRPPEYLLLWTPPAPWKDEDTFLVAMAMFDDLHDIIGRYDHAQVVMEQSFHPAARAFLQARDATWSAALDGSKLEKPLLPGPDVLDLRRLAPAPSAQSARDRADSLHGSNSWAVEGARSTTGSAIVANDMHLGLGVPNTWYRARMVYSLGSGERIEVTGVTLPGTPVVVSGSNGRVAWANTASHLDIADLIVLEAKPGQTNEYRTPQGWQTFDQHEESIRIKGGSNYVMAVQETVWGPVVTHGPNRYALAATFSRPGGMNMGMIAFETARSTSEVLQAARQAGTPLNNLVAGDRSGEIGFTLMGRIPNRVGFSGATPVSWADGTRFWNGWLPEQAYPQWMQPESGIIWTANNRVLGTVDYLALPTTGQDHGARAWMIRETLLATNHFTERALWEIYKDDRALFYAPWQELFLQTLEAADRGTNDFRELRQAVANWGGRASIDSPGFWQVAEFRQAVLRRLFRPINDYLAAKNTRNRVRGEEPAWALLRSRPAHLLNPQFASYDALLIDAAAEVRQSIPPGATYGNYNRARIQHPISGAVPALAGWLDMPDLPVSGAPAMPRVHEPEFGVSQRMIVSPGHEASGLYNMPGGQSGHFLSPFFRSEFESWYRVEPRPFLPGPTRYRLALAPAR